MRLEHAADTPNDLPFNFWLLGDCSFCDDNEGFRVGATKHALNKELSIGLIGKFGSRRMVGGTSVSMEEEPARLFS